MYQRGFAIWAIFILAFLSGEPEPSELHLRFWKFANRDMSPSCGASALIAASSTHGRSCTPPGETLPLASTRRTAGVSPRSCRMPCQSLDAREDLAKEGRRQVAFELRRRHVCHVMQAVPA